MRSGVSKSRSSKDEFNPLVRPACISISLAARISALRDWIASAIASSAALRSAPVARFNVRPARRALSASEFTNSCEFI
ncbi:unannotated protein [freshwater metagenome]|uniref:Unannotated protein n=1 Tax=freshwater metagenome TaxID=449393 RepID=A0A6J6JC48_9ZZZZ